MRAWFRNFAGACYATTSVNKKLATAQRLNYDVLSIIFTLAFTDCNEVAFTLGSVCRLWRYTALSMPQMWSKICLGLLVSPSNLRILLEYSKPLPLHIIIPDAATEKQLKVLSSATDRIVCMRMIEHFHFLENRFPILERLKLENDKVIKSDDLGCLSRVSHFPRLRELFFGLKSSDARRQMEALRPGFTGLQKLEISCWLLPHWLEIIEGISDSLVSLILRSWNGTSPLTYWFSLPQLRHLRTIKSAFRPRITFDLDAPRLESIEHVFGGFYWDTWDGILIRLRNPRSVKQLRVMAQDLDLIPYPAIRKLWIDSDRCINEIMLASLGRRIASWPELETILYSDASGEASKVFPAILDVVRNTGRDITVRKFLPSEVDLPGDIRRSNECLRSQCHQ